MVGGAEAVQSPGEQCVSSAKAMATHHGVGDGGESGRCRLLFALKHFLVGHEGAFEAGGSAGTSLAFSASSEGRKIGTRSEFPVCRRRIAFQLPCTGIGSVVR